MSIILKALKMYCSWQVEDGWSNFLSPVLNEFSFNKYSCIYSQYFSLQHIIVGSTNRGYYTTNVTMYCLECIVTVDQITVYTNTELLSLMHELMLNVLKIHFILTGSEMSVNTCLRQL